MTLPEDRQNNLELNKKVLSEFQLNRWRDLRESKLKELDIEFIRELEKLVGLLPGDKTNINLIISKKKELRDITNFDFSNIKDETEIQALIPDILL